MPISYPQPPSDVRDEALSGAGQFRPVMQPEAMVLEAQPNLVSPHQVFTLAPDVVRAGQSINAARAAGWRFFLPEAGRAEGVAAERGTRDVIETSLVNEKQKFARRQGGWLGEATNRAMKLAEKLPEVAENQYELRMLRLPAIARTDSIWLKNLGAGDDLVIPIASASKNVTAGKVYSSTEFMQLMRDEASGETFDNSPQLNDLTRE